MYSENRGRDLVLFMRASFTNLLARFPLYVRLGNRSGRGAVDEEPRNVADYFRRCVDEYCAELGVDRSFFAGKRVLEYGPGDCLGVALVLYAYGAASVHCVDHFPVYRAGPRAVAVYRAILDSLDAEARARAERAFVESGNPATGLAPSAVEYRVRPHGLSGRRGEYDVVLSRSVLALVDRVDATLADVAGALAPGGLSIHKVDLSSHGLDRDRPLDFLTWPEPLYRLMYSHKGRPNRLRVDRYQALAKASGLAIRKLAPTGRVSEADALFIRAHVDGAFRDVPLEQLSWLGFWIVLERALAA
jgi:hypothetical protein